MSSAGPIPFALLPATSAVGPDGSLTIGGCSLLDVAAEFGTAGAVPAQYFGSDAAVAVVCAVAQ